ncbi:helix-turn-helix domain-containing protein [Streptomyces specialis]|uniref:helix-turn-helix domain-containing protein n=1 Tax=Streptomyces specialis TaxID=498367 RepID=UPI00073E830F|nr:helix-turn-helix transcriptional regulator [Streptomyces specialis]
MPASSLSGAQKARVALAERLRELRLDAEITGRELARRCGWSESKSSRIENAKTSPTDADIRAWCAACDAAPRAADLIAANRQVNTMYVEWRRLERAGLRHMQESRVSLYQRTRQFHVYCSHVIPGIFQTTAYATALLETIAGFRRIPNDAAEAAQARVQRSSVIREGDHRFAVLVEETVLHYRIGDVGVMAGQLGQLLAVMSLPSVSLGVIPAAADRRGVMWPLEAFTIFDQRQVDIELLSAAVNVTAPTEVALYLRAFEELSPLAVHGAQARALIVGAIERLTTAE